MDDSRAIKLLKRGEKLCVVKLIKSHGYPVEVHEHIQTEDGYLLTMHRIPHGKENKTDSVKPVVLLLHGFLTNAADYLFTGPEKALGFMLSDKGYDIWLVNARGGRLSRKHVKFDPDQDVQYWKFSFHEIGKYDLPAIIDYIEKITGQQSMACIAHSLGTVYVFVMLSERPEYARRINLVIALSPQIIVPDVSIVYKFVSAIRHVVLLAAKRSGRLQFPPKTILNVITQFWRHFHSSRWVQEITIRALRLLNGRSSQQFTKGEVPSLMCNYPDTTSILVFKHCGELYRSGTFIKFDHGIKQNLEEYGTPKPPLYDLSKIDCPVALFCSTADLNAQPKNVRALKNLLPNCIAVHEMDNPTFSHADYLFGKETVTVLYPHIFGYLEQYSQNSKYMTLNNN